MITVHPTKRGRQIIFPPVEEATVDGLLCIGGDLEVDSLLTAYRQGIFPWPQDGYPVFWFSPPKRGILEFKDLKVPKSLSKFLKKNPFEFSLNQNFEKVIRECAKRKRPGQEDTWITEDMIEAYIRLHKAGYAISCEVWSDGKLAGGIYGVYVDGLFSGESMYYEVPNASKAAFLYLVDWLKSQGLTWIDIQMVTPVTKAFGGKYIRRKEYLEKLKQKLEG